MYVCMYIFISGIKPIEQHTDTLTEHKKERKERNNTDLMWWDRQLPRGKKYNNA